ncbi:PREDICTED: uncharacterized protein LOC104822029 [Tarenaya hassleriana]|uniref:uncharacterized protein LOC104822029 n=1 Tax=Tarenaya hassleriana TaxID=28532 RepID=UPI00053C5CA0|nr:PREDICTED: uncharacterized protein LOC104822029 [Tarenaya hassleriana]
MVRFLRTWDERNPFNGNEYRGIGFLLIDKNEDVVEGKIFHDQTDQFKHIINEEDIFVISHFKLIHNNNRYKLTEHKFRIYFTEYTIVKMVDPTSCDIIKEKFQIRLYTDLVALANKTQYLPDIIGVLVAIQGPNLQMPSSTQKIILRLLLKDNNIVKLFIWDELAAQLRSQMHRLSIRKSVIVITGVNPKIIDGIVTLSTSMSTKIYMDENLNVIKNFRLSKRRKTMVPHTVPTYHPH